ncbi:MAG: hypothetical protein RL630_604 [Verrucomicrobiota bacterium]|jgi:hypothetical protein
MRFSRILPVVILSYLVLFVRPVAAELIFDNLGMQSDGIQFVRPQGGGSGWWATGFSTTATGYVLDTVTLSLANPSNGTQFAVRIYESNNNPPTSIPTGSSVATLFNGTRNAFSEPFVLSSLGTVLQPLTKYFLAVEVATNQLNWNYTDDVNLPVASNNGGGWVGSENFPNKMSISASSAVPEPSQLAAMVLVALGVAFRIGYLRRVLSRA